LFSKYLQYIKNPPDGLGKEYDNLQHIKGACARYILTNEDNCIVSLLNAYSTLALEAKALHNSEIVKQKCRNEMNATYKAFKKLLNKNINKKNIVELLNLFTSELGKLNPQVLNSINDLLKMKIEPLINNYYLNHTHL
jgi:hypothetical protein